MWPLAYQVQNNSCSFMSMYRTKMENEQTMAPVKHSRKPARKSTSDCKISLLARHKRANSGMEGS
ncbi:hypothetical protein N431DRAFT_158766 [Stipitochalara longipes BDJ]|nr:hypothetical protein N431DRAFT_158766 [Stipitochalara longipes BDJ]